MGSRRLRLIGTAGSYVLSILSLILVLAGRGLASDTTSKYAPYWYIDSKTSASLEVVNTSKSPRDVDIVFFVRGKQRVPIDPLVVPSLGTVRLSIGELIDKKGLIEKESVGSEGDKNPWGLGERPGSLWGTAELSSEDPDHLSASILMRDPSESIGVSTSFLSPSKFWSSKLQTFWWLPSPSSQAYFALENVRPRPIKVRVTLSSDGKIGDPEAFTLSPFETKLVSLREMLPNSGGEFKNVLEIGGIELEHDGKPGDVIGRGFIVDPVVGFSLALTLEDPSRRTLNMLQNVAAPFGSTQGFPPSAQFHPELILFNASDTLVGARVTVHGKREGSPVAWEAVTLDVPPHSILRRDLEELRRQSNGLDSGFAGVDIVHTGLPSALLAVIVGIDETLRYSSSGSFTDPFSDVHNALAGVSFNLAGSNNTLYFAKNAMDRPSRFVVRISYQTAGGIETYQLPVRTVPPHQLAVIDLKQLRDSATPDKNGTILPPDLTFGQMQLITDVPNSFLGSDLTVNPVTGTCVCYFCEGGGTIEPVLGDFAQDLLDFFSECRGTTDCSYYDRACNIAVYLLHSDIKEEYYCNVASQICLVAPKTKVSNCVRLCLQEQDNCLNGPDDTFGRCQVALHAFCFTTCGITVSCYF